MYKLIEISKNYIFCDICGKCYIYKGSYEKHKLICEKKNDIVEENIIMNKKDINKIDDFTSEDEPFSINEMDCESTIREKFSHKLFTRNEIAEIICPFYLFFCALIFGFIKGIFQGFK